VKNLSLIANPDKLLYPALPSQTINSSQFYLTQSNPFCISISFTSLAFTMSETTHFLIFLCSIQPTQYKDKKSSLAELNLLCHQWTHLSNCYSETPSIFD